MGRRRGADRVTARVDTGEAELVPDPDRPRSFTLLLDGAPQSHVDLADPTHLEFEYVRRLAAALDLIAPAGAPLRVLHLGGGALTLPRYVRATRPGSTQRVCEVDAALVDLVRRELPWPADPRLRVRVADARAALESTRDAGYDVVVADVFAGARTPAHLTSVEYLAEVARVLAPGGWYLANVADGPPLRHARAQVATVRAVLPRACLVGDAAVLRGRRYGNLVLVAGRVEPPVPELTRRAAGDWFPGRVLAGDELDRFAGGAAVVRDADATDSTPPPPGIFSVRR
ncbi:spermidine synthase [Micromonospora carbonacea]|uniref:Fused MFS/spermidine synthase n=1 Tax=Micromonospora carbonacea TaxID=47853 RepID=A0A1C5AYW6_9ACTN|nr:MULTISPECIES: fused MFS/spermidine synthase [Micromonospora]MDG4818172.1 fused MFS/spermidine synthase [Micromonospora sp. WMMD956]QLD24418.1 fused MFS/spermidine synthase [Micromonospora carbonacea]SCF50415.1 Spermine/spermidine synthase [Micromonospora carbonacea]